MPVPEHELNHRLVAAVTAKDADTVKTLLRAGASSDTPGPDGLPVLCIAVAGFDYQTAEALADGGADPDRELPDGTSPLLRAVDLGSESVVIELLGNDPQARIPEPARKRLLDLARHWLETGEEEELRQRTGATGPATRCLVKDDQWSDVEEVSLGGLTVRAGHSAILTWLEKRFGIMSPVAELVARAVPYPYPDGNQLNINWVSAQSTLGERQSHQDWSDLKALRHHPDPVHRRLLADVVWSRNQWTWGEQRQDIAHDAEFLATWALDEPDGMVLDRVLEVYADEDHPDHEAIGLRYADHPDPRVRSQVPHLIRAETPPAGAVSRTLLALSRDPDPAVRRSTAEALAPDQEPALREALLALARDSDPSVRAGAVLSLCGSDDRTYAVTDALLAGLDEDDQLLRLEIVYAFARLDNLHTEHAWERVGELPPDFGKIGPHQEDHRILGYWSYQRRNRPTEPVSPTS